MSTLAERAGRASAGLERARLSVDLLLERRRFAVVLADGLILLVGIVSAMVSGSRSADVYAAIVLLPLFLLGVPVLANAVPLERRAGSLDLLLASPTAHRFLMRRVVSFVGLIALQGSAVLFLAWILGSRKFPLGYVLVQTLIVSCLVGATALFWNLRVKRPGAIVLATYISLLALSPWVFADPAPDPQQGIPGVLQWVQTNLVLSAAAIIFYLYARRRLHRTEELL